MDGGAPAVAIEFRESDHTYWHRGLEVPSVSRVLEPLDDLSMIPKAILERKIAIGHAVHKAAEFIDRGCLDDASVHPVIAGYVAAYRKFLAETGFVSKLIEQPVFSRSMWYAGTLDRAGEFPAGGRLPSEIKPDLSTLLDLKTVLQMRASTAIQTVAYSKALAECRPDLPAPQQRVALQLQEDGGYELHSYNDPSDWTVFVACRTVLNFKAKHSKRH
jgi:hypothetical protein